MYASLTPAQVSLLKVLRHMGDDTRKPIKDDLFAAVKAKFGIPPEHKLKVEIDDTNSPLFAQLIRKKDGLNYPLGSDGKWVNAPTTVATPPADPRKWVKVSEDALDYLEEEAENSRMPEDVVADPAIVAQLDELRSSSGYDRAFLGDAVYVFMDPSRL